MNTLKNNLKGCLVAGAIGDAIGGKYEGRYNNSFVDWDGALNISDDTQLTLATCDAIFDSKIVSGERVAGKFLEWFNQQRLTGLGASTFKALRELQVGGHWALVGRSGEYAAGNGAAMRIAPLAFKTNITRQDIYDICSITHKNDEAYTGALAVYYSVLNSSNNNGLFENNLINTIIDELPDTLVKDRLVELNNLKHLSITEVGQKFKPTGYVVDSVPLAIFSTQKITGTDLKTVFNELIAVGGDTDTICSIAGQIIGARIGYQNIHSDLVSKYEGLKIQTLINNLVDQWQP